MPTINFKKFFDIAIEHAKSIVLFLPRNTCINELHKFAPFEKYCYVENAYLGDKLVGVIVYYGDLAKKYIADFAKSSSSA